jgi:inorganic pyrophosphatase
MGDIQMTIETFLEKAKKFELEAYKRTPDLRVDHVAFTGAPRKHPNDDEKIVLIVDPFSAQTFFYEFKSSDIEGVEVLPSLATLEGESITMARLWVKKGCIAIKSIPFVVEDTSKMKTKMKPVE